MATQAVYTPADLDTLPPPEGGGYYELNHRGELILVPTKSRPHEESKTSVTRSFIRYTDQNPIGEVYIESKFTLFGGATRVPDVAFVLNTRLAAASSPDGDIDFVPDIAVEVISPSETVFDAEDKVYEYLTSGTAEVWQLTRKRGLVRVHTVDGIRSLRGDEMLETPVLPGYRVPVSTFFRR